MSENSSINLQVDEDGNWEPCAAQYAFQAPVMTFECSKEMGEFYKAMAKVQAEIQNPKKTKKVSVPLKNGGKKEYWYAPIEASYEEIRKVGPKNGICFFQDIETKGSEIIITTEVGHESGQYRRTRVVAVMPEFTDYHGKPRKPSAQECAASITYFRRYAINGSFAIAGEDDLDGEEIAENDREGHDQKKPQVQKPTANKPIPNFAPQSAPAATQVKSGDPADFVMTLGSQEVLGKKLRDLNENTLKAIRDWSKLEMKKEKDPKRMNQLIEINVNSTEFLKSVGVE